MHTPRKPASGPLIIPCSGHSYLGRLTVAAARALSSEGEARLLTVGVLPDFSAIRRAVDGCGWWIAVDGCERQCMKHLLDRIERSPEFHLTLPDLGLEQKKTVTVAQEELQLAKDGILAGATRVSGIFPVFPGCGCC